MGDKTVQYAMKELVWNDELQAFPLTWTFEELNRQNNNKTIDFEIAFQRGYVWTNKDNSNYIQSILCGMVTGTILLNKNGNMYEGLDGKQRAYAVCKYINNDYKLHKNTEPIIFEGKKYVIGGCHFEDLPNELQTRIKSRTIDIYWFDNLSADNKIKVFTRVNSGKPVTKADIARIKVKSRAMFLKLIEHPAIKSGLRLIDIKKCVDEDVIKWIWCILNNETPSLLQSYTSKILETTEVSDEQKEELIKILDYMEVLVNEGNRKENKLTLNKMRLRTHFTMLGYMASVAINKGVGTDEFAEKAFKLFNTGSKTPTNSPKYNEAMKDGTSSPENVRIRMQEVEKALLS